MNLGFCTAFSQTAALWCQLRVPDKKGSASMLSLSGRCRAFAAALFALPVALSATSYALYKAGHSSMIALRATGELSALARQEVLGDWGSAAAYLLLLPILPFRIAQFALGVLIPACVFYDALENESALDPFLLIC